MSESKTGSIGLNLRQRTLVFCDYLASIPDSGVGPVFRSVLGLMLKLRLGVASELGVGPTFDSR